MENNTFKSEFLSNQPYGEDLLKGQSQDKVAEAIKLHILNEDSKKKGDNEEEIEEKTLPRIIGVEGSWGSGKSNMLLQLQNKLKDSYHVFTYDAWGNQEDLQRRSILELLTDDLIQHDMLIEPTKYKIISTDMNSFKTKTCSWRERLFTLVARKSATHNVTIPKIESSTKWFALALLATGIMATLVGPIDFIDCGFLNFIIKVALVSLPMLSFCGLRRYKHKQQIESESQEKNVEKITGWDWKEMWSMYQTEGTQDSTTFTISDLEPSIFEFREWMTDLEGALKNDFKLIIVFDNMDRLPRDKVCQLWSSIQTFFAGKGYKKVWCIIPFDRTHLANAFADDIDANKEQLTNFFVEKTFPVVYRIPEPIITDYRGVFDTLFEKALGKRAEMDLINRCYRLRNSKPNMREIISFINKCVSLNHTWGDKISLTSIALFVLNSDHIFKGNTDQIIIDGEYNDGFDKIIEVNEELTTEISALVYGVEKDVAAQLPLKNIVRKALSAKESANFGTLAKEKKNFFVILDEETKDMDPTWIDTAVKQIADVKLEDAKDGDKLLLDKVWMKMANLYLGSIQNETTFRPEVKLLMDHCPGKALKERIGKKFLDLFTSGEKNEHKGEEWYSVYKDFDSYVKEKELNLTLPEKNMKAGDYVAYVKAAKADYKNYLITTSNEDLNKDLSSRVADGIDILDVLRTIQGDERYSLTGLSEGARAMIEGETATDDNIESALNVCKELSKEPLNLKVKLSFLDQLTHSGGAKYDLQVLRVLQGKNLTGMTDEDYAKMAQVAYSYVNTDELWEKTISVGSTVLAKIMGWLIADNRHKGQLKVDKDMITGMASIHSRTGAGQQVIIKFVNDWGKKSLNDTEKGLTLSNALSSESWVSALLAEKNDYSKAVLGKYYNDFNVRPITEFLNSSNGWVNPTYWLIVLGILIDDPVFKTVCKEKLIEITGRVVEGISTGNIHSGNSNQDLQTKLLNWVDFIDVSSKVSDAMVRFAQKQPDISKYMFMNLHHYLVKLTGSEAHFLNYALTPLINEEEVQQIVLDNLSVYEPLIHNNISQASNLKDAMIKLYGTTKNEELKALIERLGIVVHEEPSEGSEEVKDDKK